MKYKRIFLNQNDDRVFIDTYVADAPNVRDAILVIPGGGYFNVCSDREGEPIALEFFARGYNAFVLNYRVGKGDRFPSQLLDASAAMIYIREHSKDFKINPERVFAVGFSAGGHLCGCLASMVDYPEVKDAFGESYPKAKPTGVILSYPVTVMTGPTHINSFVNLLGKKPEEFTDADISKYSLERVVKSDTSPMFIWHTLEDKTVPVDGSLALASALVKVSVPFELAVYPYGPHGLALSNEITSGNNPSYIQPIAEGWTDAADKWMKTIK